PALNIVEALKPLAERLNPRDEHGQIVVFFLEVYGRKIGGAAKQHTGNGNLGYRLFDIACLLPDVLDWPREHVTTCRDNRARREQISTWRDNGGQRFCTEAALQRAAEAEAIELTPRLETVPGDALPTDIEEMAAFLAGRLPVTRVALDEGAGHQPEGIVLRTADRSVIAKARFQDYTRTLKRRANRR